LPIVYAIYVKSDLRLIEPDEYESDAQKESDEREVMESLMNRIVAKPLFGDDPKINQKIDKLLKVKAF